MKKKALSLALTLVMCLGLTVSVFADNPPHTYQHKGYQVTNVLEEAFGPDIFHPEDEDAWPLLTCIAPVDISVTMEYKFSEYGKDAGYMEGDRTQLNGTETKFTLTEPGFYYIDFFWKDEEFYYDQCQILIKEGTNATTPTTPVQPDEGYTQGLAYASTQTVTVDGKEMEFQMYALKDGLGNGTNYIKLRDMAQVLNGTKAQFSVGYDGTISLTTGQAYASTGTEMKTPFSGDRLFKGREQTIQVDGKEVSMFVITLTDDAGGGYNYFKLRDLGQALGFNVGYSNEQGVFIESDKPYAG